MTNEVIGGENSRLSEITNSYLLAGAEVVAKDGVVSVSTANKHWTIQVCLFIADCARHTVSRQYHMFTRFEQSLCQPPLFL